MIRRQFLFHGAWAAVSAAAALFLKPARSWGKELHDFSGTPYVGKTRAGPHEKFYINFWKPMRRIDGARWKLEVTGLCESPRTFSLDEIKSFDFRERSSRLKCVECWSARAKWGGFSFTEIERLTRPSAEAVGVLFHCQDDYAEYLDLESLRREETLLVHQMNGKPLSDEHGFPLRVIAPFKYGYKNPKAILKMQFVSQQKYGTWSRIGPYSADGTILPGADHPLEFNKQPRRISGGEIRGY